MSAATGRTYVRIAVPFLAVPWTGVAVGTAFSPGSTNPVVRGVVIALALAVWYGLLFQVVRGNATAIAIMPFVVLALAGVLLVKALLLPLAFAASSHLFAAVIGAGGDLPGFPGDSVSWWVVVTVNALAIAAAIMMRTRAVEAWAARRF